jgi:hypothetical protein
MGKKEQRKEFKNFFKKKDLFYGQDLSTDRGKM